MDKLYKLCKKCQRGWRAVYIADNNVLVICPAHFTLTQHQVGGEIISVNNDNYVNVEYTVACAANQHNIQNNSSCSMQHLVYRLIVINKLRTLANGCILDKCRTITLTRYWQNIEYHWSKHEPPSHQKRENYTKERGENASYELLWTNETKLMNQQCKRWIYTDCHQVQQNNAKAVF